MRKHLEAAGYEQLFRERSVEAEIRWEILCDPQWFITHCISNSGAGFSNYCGFQIVASHSDSPSFKIKTNPEMNVEEHYVKLNVEKYGGMLCAPWFDRPLSVAGRLIVKRK